MIDQQNEREARERLKAAHRPAETRRYIETVLGPLKVVPECKALAVCVNGLVCWEAGRCLRSGALPRTDLAKETE